MHFALDWVLTIQQLAHCPLCISYAKVLTLAFRLFALFALCNECFPSNTLRIVHCTSSCFNSSTMHCNSLRTACFVVLEHFMFTITTVVCALPIANRRWGRVARVSHALCSQIQVFPTWRIVFLYFLCFFLCLCSQIEAPLFPVSPSLFLIAFLMHRVLRNKRSKCLAWSPVLFGKNQKIPPQKILLDELFLKWDFLSFLFLPTPYIFVRCMNVWTLDIFSHTPSLNSLFSFVTHNW